MTPEELAIYNDTVDFVVRRSDIIETLIAAQPQIFKTHIISNRYIICYTKRAYFEDVLNSLGANFITSASFILGPQAIQNLEPAGIIQVQRQPYLDLKGTGVLIGFVDTGIDYTLDTFKYEDGTSKIQFLLDQTIISSITSEGYLRGTEYTNADLNEALASDDPFSVVPSIDEDGHGTFLASVSAGRQVDDFIGAAPNSEIIAVKLRKARSYYLERYAVPTEQENAFESTSIMLAIDYILNKAEELGKPVVICIGLGTNIGSHDGFSIFEEYLSSIANLVGVCICIAAGNESQARHHTNGVVDSSRDVESIDIQVGENAGDIFISIWNGVPDRLSVSVRSPTGELVARVPAKNNLSITNPLILENAAVNIQYFFPLEGTGSQVSIVRILHATPGIWTIYLHGDIILDGTYHAWLPIRGFVSPNVEFLSATPYYTITIPGTAFEIMCCGAYNSVYNSLYSDSSWGPTRALISRPDFVAPGVGILGYYPFGYGTMSGTSVANAITCGACALMMQWGIVNGNEPFLSTYQIRAYLIRGCRRSETMVYPNEKWGYGILDLIQAFNHMREI